ncbi:hypothetical protein DFH08DRAFT_953228 [Mycena albidolilacea]|uniref:Uncharacterized protein n=1 Tax=Mycena albidolilacea TaxID=1033008 RepID=A0AAD7EXQ6_9AGAR|nr:hypothetical protein DFH08DRAFT_953228 [Mycena albidolilacea]
MAQRTRKAATAKPYQRSRPPRLDFLETDVSKTRLDINISSLAIQKKELAAPPVTSSSSNLALASISWTQEIQNFCVIRKVCKGCWCFDQRNPEYDWDEAAIWGPPVAPPCTCPPGLTSYETVPPGMMSASRPKTRTDLQADLATLSKSIPSDVARCQECDALFAHLRVQSETASEKVGDAIAQVQLLCKTRLRDFNMRPPSPIIHLPCLAVVTSAMNYGAPRMRGSLVPAHMKNRNWNNYYRQQYPGEDTKNFDDDNEEGEAVE